MFLRHTTDDENVRREQRPRRLTGRLGMESPARHEPAALKRVAGDLASANLTCQTRNSLRGGLSAA